MAFPDKWKYLTKNLAYEYFISIDDNQKTVKDLKKDYFFSRMKVYCPTDKKKNEPGNLLKNSILKLEKN